MDLSSSERSDADFKADKKRKFPELFSSSSSDDSDNETCRAYPSQTPRPTNLIYEPPTTMPYKSKSSEYGACQQWSRYCKWYEDLSGAIFSEFFWMQTFSMTL